MTRLLAGALALGLTAGCAVSPQPARPPMQVVVIGDSTAAAYPPHRYPQLGWAMILPCALDAGVTVHNDAKGGRSTKSFRGEGWWSQSRDRLRPGDVLLIQFGHNDQSVEKGERYIEARPGFQDNLKLFVAAARERGASPVLITPVTRRRIVDGRQVDVHGDYDDVVREVAAATATPLIDLQRDSMDLLDQLGEEPSKALFLHLAAQAYPSHPDGLIDNTHFSESGARAIAGLVAARLAALDTPLAGRVDAYASALSASFHAGGPACSVAGKT